MKKIKKTKALLSVNLSSEVSLSRAKFTPAEHTKYLNTTDLKRIRKTKIEIGSLKLSGSDVPLIATLERGMLTAVSLKQTGHCDCNSQDQKFSKQSLLQIQAKMKESNIPTLKLPIPISVSRSLGWRIPIGPVIIGTQGVDCIFIDDTKHKIFCVICPSFTSCSTYY